jgi:hypothetical protein
MKPSLDQLLQCFEQITQQLETLEIILAAVDPKLHQRNVTDWRQPITSETGAVRGAALSKFLDSPLQTPSIPACPQSCSSYSC